MSETKSPLSTPRNVVTLTVDRPTNRLLQRLSPEQQRGVALFVKSTSHQGHADEVTHTKWVAQCMEHISHSALSKAQRKHLVTSLYKEVAHQDSNGFNPTFSVGSAFDLIWDVEKQRYGVTANKTGLCGCLPCCSSDSVENQIETNILPILLPPPLPSLSTSLPHAATPPVSDASTPTPELPEKPPSFDDPSS